MKKTSKKLLSFFLAVVMIVTSCSVGLTAFAADNKASNGYWSTDADAEAAFDSLNELVDTYVPKLLNVPKIKDFLETNLKMEITEDTSIDDVVAGVSPILLPLLLGLAPDKGAIREDYSKMADTYYAYLDDSKAVMDFYTLYQFCAEYPDAQYKEGGKVVWSSKEVKKQLDKLLNVYKNAKEDYDTKYNAIFDVFYGELYDEVANNFEGGDFYNATIEEIENAKVYGKAFKDWKNDDAQFAVDYVKGILDGVNSSAKIDNIADAFYYLICDSGQHDLTTEIYLGLALKAGATITTESIGGSAEDVLDMENYKELIKKANPDITPYEFFVPVDNYVGASDSPFFGDIATGYLAYFDYDAEEISQYNVTDEQIDKFIEDTFTNGAIFKGRTESGTALVDAGDIQAYLESDNCAFSKYVSNSLDEFASSYAGNLVEFLQMVYSTDSAEQNAKAMKNSSLDFGDFAPALSAKSFVEAMNAIVPSTFILENCDDAQTSNIGFTVSNVEFAYRTLNPYKTFIATKTAKFKYDYSKYALPKDYAVELTNNALNDTIDSLFGPESTIPIQDIIDKLLESNVGKLQDLLKNIWSGLYKDPIATVAKLLPVVAIVADELVIPIILNGEGDLFNGEQNILYQFLVNGEGTLLYPYSQAAGSEIGIGALDFDLNKALPAICHWLTGDKDYDYAGTVGYYTEAPYLTDVPKFLNIYIADQAIWAVGEYGWDELFKQVIPEDENLANILAESIETVVGFLGSAVDEYVAEHKDEVRVNKDGKQTQAGMNNIFVALPEIINIAGQDFLAKYDIDSDWTYTYEGKITQADNGNYVNNTLNGFKMLAKENNADKVLENGVDIIIGNILNGALDFANDILSDTDNEFKNNFELVYALLQTLGGLGEKSVITDVLNGFFETTRSEDISFTLEEREKTHFNGFSNKSGLFLLSNLDRLVSYFIGFLKTSSLTTSGTSADNSPYLVKKAPQASSFDDILTPENIKAANELVDTLDTLLSSLLKNSALNNFKLNKTDSILLGLASLECTPEIIKVTKDYINYANDQGKYTSKNLSNLVTETYILLENLINDLLGGIDGDKKLVAGAVNGVISPDSVGIRMNGYSATSKILLNNHRSWTDLANKDLKYGFKNGDKDAFYDALGESLNGIASVVGLLLSQVKDSSNQNYYELIVNPLLSDISKAVGSSVKIMTPTEFNSAKPTSQLVNGIMLPLFGVLDKIFTAPATSLIKTIQVLCPYLEDSALKALFTDAVAPINGEIATNIKGAATILKNLSSTLSELVSKVEYKLDLYELLNIPEKDSIVTLINDLIGGLVVLEPIDWIKVSKYSVGEAILFVYGYAFDTLIGSDLIRNLLESVNPKLAEIVTSLTPAEVLTILSEVLAVAQSPTEVFWTFSEYASKVSGSFTYPTRITAKDAENAVGQLDNSVDAVFALLKNLGVANIDGLSSLVNDNLYTNEMLSKIAIEVYSAVENFYGNPLTDYVADKLMDSSYGATFSSAAKAIRSKSSWKSFVKTNKDGSKTYTIFNWGFKDGSAKAETGFINGLAAIARPINDLLAVFLTGDATGKFSKQDINSIIDIVNNINISSGNVTIKAGILTVEIESKKAEDPEQTKKNYLQIDLAKTATSFLNEFIGENVGFGTNGYENAIVPVLEAFMCKGVKTQKEYVSDYNKTKDNLIIDILKPITSLIDDACDAPFDTITKILPNVAYFIDSNGLSQVIANLLSPITSSKGILGVLADHNLNLDQLIELIAGKPLNKIIADAIGIKVNFSMDLNHLEKCDIQNIVLPLVSKLLDDKLGIRLPSFDFDDIASHGTVSVVSSAAKNSDGKYTTRQIVADQGEVLVAVLRYVADTLIKNTTPIKNLLLNIDAIKKNDTIKSIIVSVLDQLKTASKDDIVRSVFYILLKEGQDNFFDYSNFKFGENIFGWGELDKDFCETLPPMLDGLIGGLLEGNGGLMEIVGGAIYKDEIVAKLAKGLYNAIEGVKISPEIGSLTSLLSHFDIDFSTANVAALLTNKDYGEVYASAASAIKSAGSWKNVKEGSLSFGVKDRESFVNALCAVLRPLYGVLDVFLNDSYLNLANIAYVPGSDCYTSVIVPLLEAFSCYNIKTQYQYREDMNKKYDSILIDIINPLLDKVEDLLIAPVQTLTSMLPNLSLFFANDGLLQVLDNLLTPATALIEALHPIVDVNELLKALNFNINSLLASTGLNLNINLDIYDIKSTLKPLIGAENVVTLLNKILGIIKIGGNSLGIELPEIDWLRLASHGDVIKRGTSQAGTAGTRVYVLADSAEQEAETLIAVLRFAIDTVNYKGNYDAIVKLITGLLGEGVSDSIADTIGQVLGMLEGDSDTVIKDLVDLLQSLAG